MKIRMISFLEGVDRDLPQYLHNPPFIPTMVVPRVPTTATTEEVAEQIKPKNPDIFELLDSCDTSKDLWEEL